MKMGLKLGINNFAMTFSENHKFQRTKETRTNVRRVEVTDKGDGQIDL